MRGNAALKAIRAIMAGAPQEAETDVDSLWALAPHLFVLDMNEGQPVYRLAGSAVQCAFGADPHGRSYYENWSRDAHPALQSFFHAATESCCAFHVFSDGLWSWGAYARYETVLIPVAIAALRKNLFIGVNLLLDGDADSKRPAMLQHLRCIAFLHDGSRAPRRLYPRPVPA
jgi:hypothetical protein